MVSVYLLLSSCVIIHLFNKIGLASIEIARQHLCYLIYFRTDGQGYPSFHMNTFLCSMHCVKSLSLRRQGVTDFATANVKDFEGFGFRRVGRRRKRRCLPLLAHAGVDVWDRV
jgi:hypothetical protein